MLINYGDAFIFCGLTDHRERTPLTLTNGDKPSQVIWHYRQDITLLGFVTPYFNRRHARLIIGYGS